MPMASAARRIEVIYDVPSANDRWLLEADDVPESPLHDAIILLLVEVLLAWKRRESRDAMIGRNIALRWNSLSPRQGVDPDVYVVEPPPPEGEDATSLCTWKPGHRAPRLAVEVVSENTADKDYGDGPDRYAASGTNELWVFDPLSVGPSAADVGMRGGPYVLQVWRRDEGGAFRRVYAGAGPARSEELGAWIVITDDGRRLRIAEDQAGERLWPTIAEAERAEKEAERASRQAAEEEVRRLREELGRLKG
jgi:Uma2 family endonuclease